MTPRGITKGAENLANSEGISHFHGTNPFTHNDTLISEASNLYEVSMQENISKITSLKV